MENHIGPTPQQLSTGGFPNVYFNCNAGTLSDVKHTKFIPLPNLESINILDCASYRYIAEKEDLWSRLHRGRLTTSRLNATLGLYEPHAAKILGLPRKYVSHNKLISVFHHLREEAFDYFDGEGNVCLEEKSLETNLQAHMAAYVDHCEMVQNGATIGHVSDKIKLKKSRYLNSMKDINKVRMAWGSAQEASTVSLLCHELQDASFFFLEVGMMALEPNHTLLQNWGFQMDQLPPIGATPDGLFIEECADAQFATTEFAKRSDIRFKVVEIKNVCPFSARKKGKNGFEIRDRGPRSSVDALYVPQLQFHMLCSGAASAFLISRSATKGTNIFEMKRDDEYIRAMLEIIRCFYTTYILKDKVPPHNAFSHMRLHKQLLLKTRELAFSCPLYCHIDQKTLDGTDMRPFMDDLNLII